jgi:CHAT domain-containing protein/Tfp pilus assembly protein PilF
MGDISAVQFQYAQAESSHEQALTIYSELHDRPSEALTVEALAGDHFDLADYPRALALYERALTIRNELGDRLGESRTLNNMGLVYDSMSLYQEALVRYQEALKIKQDIGDRTGQAAVLANVAGIYGSLSENDRALTTYGQALELARLEGNQSGEMAVLTSIGTVLRQMGRYAEALEYHQQALSIARKTGDQRGEAASLGSLAVLHDLAGEDSTAVDLQQQALAIRERIEDRVGQATSLTLLGELYAESADYEQAESYLLQALATWQATGDRRSEAMTLGDLAVAFDRQGQETEAVRYALLAVDSLESIYTKLKAEDLQSGFANSVAGYYQYTVRLLLRQGQGEEAFLLAERGRARTFLNLLGNEHVDAQGGEDTGLIQQAAEKRAALAAVERVLRGDAKPDDERAAFVHGDPTAALESLRQEYADLLAELQLRSPEYASMVSVDPLTVEQVQALLQELAPDATLVSYFVGDEQTIIFLITADQFHVVDVQVSEADQRRQLEALLAEMKAAPLREEAWKAPAQALYDWLIAPVEEFLPRNARGSVPRVGIIPYGQLHYLPFGLLHAGTGARGDKPSLLLDRVSLFYAPSASSLRFILSKRHAGSGDILAMANPDALGAPHLEHVVREAEAVAALFDATPVLGSEATESRFKAMAGQSWLIHLAAHSDLQPAIPLFSAILLEPDDTDDGRLETHEVLNLSLPGADLVVLSACQTHLGALSAGDELVGLERAFLRAGTSSLLTTLWPVDDEATAALMQSFYRLLRSGVPKAEALRQAQRSTRERYPQPYYWAGLAMVGDPGAAPSVARPVSWWLWVATAAGGLGLVAVVTVLVLGQRRKARR